MIDKLSKTLQRWAQKTLAFAVIMCYSVFAQVGKASTHPAPIRASFYAPKFENRLMANGHRYHGNVMSAASLHFPLGTRVRVRNIKTGQSVIVHITDRGPWRTRFGLDLSKVAFHALGFDSKMGWGWVTVEKVKDAHGTK